MKVLIIHPKVPIYGGAERVIVKLCEYMSNNAIVHALAMPNVPEEMKQDLIKVGTPIIDNIPALLANINNYDVINFHNFPATLFSMITNKPQVWYCNEPPELFTSSSRKFIEWGNRNLVKNRIENVIVADKYNARRFFNIYNVVPKIIPYGIDYEFFSQIEHRPNPDYFTVLQVGTVTPYKNQLATIEAVSRLVEKIPNIRLWLIGDSGNKEYKALVEDAIREKDIAGLTTVIPHSSREYVRLIYASSDVLIHPVREQGGWLTPFEAMSVGVPVIVSPELSCADMIKDNQLGMVSEDYATALYQIYQNLEDIDTSTQKKWVKNNLTWDKFGESMVNYFKQISTVKVRQEAIA